MKAPYFFNAVLVVVVIFLGYRSFDCGVTSAYLSAGAEETAKHNALLRRFHRLPCSMEKPSTEILTRLKDRNPGFIIDLKDSGLIIDGFYFECKMETSGYGPVLINDDSY